MILKIKLFIYSIYKIYRNFSSIRDENWKNNRAMGTLARRIKNINATWRYIYNTYKRIQRLIDTNEPRRNCVFDEKQRVYRFLSTGATLILNS